LEENFNPEYLPNLLNAYFDKPPGYTPQKNKVKCYRLFRQHTGK